MALWGIDLGGTKIEGAVLANEHSLKTLARLRLPTEQQFGYQHILSQIARVIDLLTQSCGFSPEAIGIGTPGTFDPQTGAHKNSNTQVINGKPFREDLEKKLGVPVKMANDANCFALAEATLGAARSVKKADVVFGIIMGTGVGGGIVINGKVLNGFHGIGGEWGHNFLHESGGRCYCGKVGCVETLISGPFLEKYYASLSGETLKLKDIYEAYKNGNNINAQLTIQRLLSFFGLAVSNIVNIIDPDVIIIGGGVGNIDVLYTEGIKEIEKHVFNPRFEAQVLPPVLGDSAGVFGAALL